MKMIKYSCPECGAEMESPDQLEGGTDFCPECRSSVEVPPALASESLEENEEDQAGESEVNVNQQNPRVSPSRLRALRHLRQARLPFQEFGEGVEDREVKDTIAVLEEIDGVKDETTPAPVDRLPKWYERLMGPLGCLVQIAGLVLFAVLFRCVVWLSPRILPWLVLASYFALAVSVLILLPLSLISATRAIGGIGMMYASYVFGITVWFGGFFLAYAIWGVWAVIVGLVLLGIGVVPVAMLATLVNGIWSELLWLVVLLVLVWGTRIFGAWVTSKADSEWKGREFY